MRSKTFKILGIMCLILFTIAMVSYALTFGIEFLIFALIFLISRIETNFHQIRYEEKEEKPKLGHGAYVRYVKPEEIMYER